MRTVSQISRDQRARNRAAYRARILIVDDLSLNREIAAALLEAHGFLIAEAESGEAAVGYLSTDTADLVLMDIRMPLMNGIEATQIIRGLGTATRSIPILAVSSETTDEAVQSYAAAGMNGLVAKPVDEQVLLREIERHLSPRARGRIEHDTPLLDRNKLQEMTVVLGAERARMLALAFADQLEHSFLSNQTVSQREAHDLINAAGVMGLEQLVDLCRQIQDDRSAASGRDETLMRHVRKLKNQVLAICRKEIIPSLTAGV